jgi:MFS family permease
MVADSQPVDAAPAAVDGLDHSAFSPLRLPLFRMLWVATLVSNVGTWMHEVGAGWLMTSLSPSPVMVALVQTATTLPVFLLALPAGALSDIVDRRRYLLAVQVWMAGVAALLGALTLTGLASAWSLVVLTFAMGIGTAMMMPAWAALTPDVVPREQWQAAIALNSLGINVARAIGPALAGFIVSMAGTGAVFVLNAVSYLGIVYVLARWRRRVTPTTLPTERFGVALRSGLRFARHAPELQAAAVRGLGFFIAASASWALLPLVARDLIDGGPQAFGLLVGALGAGAVLGALVLPPLRRHVSRDALVAGASVAYALSMLGLASIDRLWLLMPIIAFAGAAWITTLSSLQVAAQMALPDWVRSRGLAVFMMVFMGSMAFGSLAWGSLAALIDVSTALGAAALTQLIAIVLVRHARISGFQPVDLSPSLHWPEPDAHDGITHERGPVMVTVEYLVAPEHEARFLDAMATLRTRRRRDGAFAWGMHEDVARRYRYVESFHLESWLEHLRQHERVTDADRVLQQQIRDLLIEGTAPRVEHYVAP